jgi:hypothetical protein
MALTPVSVFGRETVPFIHPTEVGEVRFIERVSIFDRPDIDKTEAVVVGNFIDEVFRDHWRDSDDMHRNFISRKEGWVPPKNIWRLLERRTWDGFPVFDNRFSELRKDKVIGRSCAEILSPKVVSLLRLVPEIFKIARDQSDVRSELASFRVAGNPALEASGAKSEGGEEYGKSFEPYVLSLISAGAMVAGLWMGILGRRRWMFPVGAALAAIGWLGQVGYPLINYL